MGVFLAYTWLFCVGDVSAESHSAIPQRRIAKNSLDHYSADSTSMPHKLLPLTADISCRRLDLSGQGIFSDAIFSK